MSRGFSKGVVLGAVTSTLVLMAATALAGTGVGAVFNLGKTNTVDRQSVLAGATSNANLRVRNTGAGPAGEFDVTSGHAPFTVNSTTKVAHLNADELDGVDAAGFVQGSGAVAHNRLTVQGTDQSEPIVVGSPLANVHGACSSGSGARMYLDGNATGNATWFNKDGYGFETFVDGQMIDITPTTITPYLVVVQLTDTNGQVTTFTVAMHYGSLADLCTFAGQAVTT